MLQTVDYGREHKRRQAHRSLAWCGTNLEGKRLARDRRVCWAQAERHCRSSEGGGAPTSTAASPAPTNTSPLILSFMLYIWRINSRRCLQWGTPLSFFAFQSESINSFPCKNIDHNFDKPISSNKLLWHKRAEGTIALISESPGFKMFVK